MKSVECNAILVFFSMFIVKSKDVGYLIYWNLQKAEYLTASKRIGKLVLTMAVVEASNVKFQPKDDKFPFIAHIWVVQSFVYTRPSLRVRQVADLSQGGW